MSQLAELARKLPSTVEPSFVIRNTATPSNFQPFDLTRTYLVVYSVRESPHDSQFIVNLSAGIVVRASEVFEIELKL